MRPPVFFLKLHFYYKARLEKQKFIGNLIRLQTLQLVNIQLKRDDQLKKVSDLWRYSWDDNENISVSETENKESINKITELIDKYL